MSAITKSISLKNISRRFSYSAAVCKKDRKKIRSFQAAEPKASVSGHGHGHGQVQVRVAAHAESLYTRVYSFRTITYKFQ